MSAAGLERAVLVATGVVQPVAEVLRQLTGATVLLDAAEPCRAEARDFAKDLKGWYWAVPVELTGVYNGAACVLVSQELVAGHGDEEAAASFASMIDEYAARAGEKLAPAWGGPVSLDRLGLRRTPAGRVPKVLSDSLGTGGLVAVRFPATSAEGGPSGEVLVVLGGRLVHELAGELAPRDPPGAASTRPVASRSATDLIARARALKVRASADVGRRTMTLGELATLAPGSVIDLGKNVTEPLELGVQGRLIAFGDAVTLPRGFGFRVRYLGVK